jgi:predicted RNase H-like nuclease (RuvC/YqgF family)
VDPQPAQAATGIPEELSSVESGLRALWESAHRAAETLSRLREEKRELQGTVGRMEKEITLLKAEVAALKQKITEHGGNGKESPGVSGKNEELLARARDIIAKLDAYL